MRKIFFILILFSGFSFAGTTGKLTGLITDSQNGEPLIGANILIEGTDLGAASNAEGKFLILNIPPGIYKVRVSYLSYETVLYEQVRIVVDQTTELTVSLSPK
ncbi:MAG TPA: carboxypeptidase-like regulatory domain-containing protein, partial [Ignavibacteriaceae bacterium]|nr:carboxypeptidase-like regulatory domain-containing protein [Ignavibacteriaceae bacterium]